MSILCAILSLPVSVLLIRWLMQKVKSVPEQEQNSEGAHYHLRLFKYCVTLDRLLRLLYRTLTKDVTTVL